ncbi:glucose-6-phosphate dehydrogenase [Paenibacillus ginsengarvi]|uniref:Glucose-6-phosphate 1-dehydrogenase n=1 Tax=Paenibacillus ginsengarvi TaxID=400777 RepID=A0A3B0CEE6_9BACL|nr:glucose-6-phosphate dehydrogenase [Paenibacillus ginsengarvi]RKN84435.1 glucose-6-phosphate dehydrogenase [Paenibacillus ginsengarvi]
MEASTFILFGATGDLAKRKIYPALYTLFLDNKLPDSFSVFGLGRREWSDETFRANVERSIREFSRHEAIQDEQLNEFLEAFRFCILDAGRKDDYVKLLRMVESREEALGAPPNRLFYLSVGPEFFETIAFQIRESGLGSANGWKRLVIEKPFGHDLPSARELNRKLSEAFEESEIFRIDHYLGKPIVQRLEELREIDSSVRELWNRPIANVQITASETVGVEERAGYYDQAGAVRDMFQNHMLQLLMMVATHLPGAVGVSSERSKKQAMESLRPLHKQEAGAFVIRGQYGEGTISGKPVAGYTSEPGIAPQSANDTFIAAKLRIEDDFWSGVPFYIRTGKRMKRKSTRIVVEFGETDLSGLSAAAGKAPNLLVFEIGPNDAITMQHVPTGSPQTGKPETIPVYIPDRGSLPEAYESLIYDALLGDPTFFVRWDEVELSWQWVQPVLEAFEQQLIPLRPYAAGSNGPDASDALLAEEGHHWWDNEPELQNGSKEGESYACHVNH